MSQSWNPDQLLNEVTLMHAQESYRPSRMLSIEAMTLAHWAERASAQPELVTARELAGLSDERLVALNTEFCADPRMKRPAWLVWGSLGGTGGVLAGIMGMALTHWISGGPSSSPVLSVLFALMLVVGLALLGVSSVLSYRSVPLNAAYGRVGLYVGELNEQHPWLYKVLLLMRDPGAEAYRQRVLKERGLLRGVDYLMMREIAAVSENMVLTQTARSVRERVQATSGRVPALSRREALVEAGWASSSAASTPATRSGAST